MRNKQRALTEFITTGIIKKDSRVSQQATVNKTAISRERVQMIIADFGVSKVAHVMGYRNARGTETEADGHLLTIVVMNMKATNRCATLSDDDVKAAVKM